MKAFTNVTGAAIPLGLKNVDTDFILPGKHLKVLTRTGLGRFAFTVLRYYPDGVDRPDSIFNRQRYHGSPIIIARENFGCGSSREHAAWALADLGVRAVIAPSFGDIFAGNAFRNGILTVVLSENEVEDLLQRAESDDVTVDLESQVVSVAGLAFRFEIDPFRKFCLLQGLDEISLTQSMDKEIAVYERRAEQDRPWAFSTRES